MVDVGVTCLCVTEGIALQLGFDLDEVSRQVVTLADGHQRKVPRIAPIRDCLREPQLCYRGGGAGRRAVIGRDSFGGDGLGG